MTARIAAEADALAPDSGRAGGAAVVETLYRALAARAREDLAA